MVWAQLEKKGQWERAVIKSIHDSRSYWITTETGGEYRRNRVHLRPRVSGAPKVVPTHEAGPALETTRADVIPATELSATAVPDLATTAAAKVPALP